MIRKAVGPLLYDVDFDDDDSFDTFPEGNLRAQEGQVKEEGQVMKKKVLLMNQKKIHY